MTPKYVSEKPHFRMNASLCCNRLFRSLFMRLCSGCEKKPKTLWYFKPNQNVFFFNCVGRHKQKKNLKKKDF